MYLLLIETSSNQDYLFATNKLRENVGASELTYRACTEWVLEVVAQQDGCTLWDPDPKRLRSNILNANHTNPPIETGKKDIEVIIATSGKALLLVRDRGVAKQIIQKVTFKALVEAPGLNLCGVIKECDFEKEKLWQVYRGIHHDFETVRNRQPGVGMRYQRLPIATDCKTSGLPAATLRFSPEKQWDPISRTSLAKYKVSKAAIRRMNKLLNGRDLSESINQLESISSWVAVIHADGNGLGQIFLNFENYLSKYLERHNQSLTNRSYLENLRRFSIALEVCTENAFLNAINAVFPQESEENPKSISLIPLVLGGDDLTVICDGNHAIHFAYAFLKEFEFFSADLSLYQGIIPSLAQEALNAPRLSACAGIAIIKPHFPFSIAYELSDDLTKSAKSVKAIVKTDPSDKNPFPCSALDFHVLYDSSAISLKQIRKKLDINLTRLYSRPYIVTDLSALTKISADAKAWAESHAWEHLVRRIVALNALDELDASQKKIPKNQTHDLRSSLFLGQKAADSRLNLLWSRYQNNGLDILATNKKPPSLFYSENGKYVTHLFDALEIADFFQGTPTGLIKLGETSL